MRAAVCRLALATSVVVSPCSAAAQEVYEVVRPFAETPRHVVGGLEGSDGTLYFVAAAGGTHNVGAIVSLRRNASGVMTRTVLHHFSGPDGSIPLGGLAEVGGVLYGTTAFGGTHGFGTIFSLTPEGVFTLLHSFDGVNGDSPQSRLVLAADGYLYGTTTCVCREVVNQHTIFRTTLAGAVTVLHRFTGSALPGDLVVASDGNLYGATAGDGAAVFRLTLGGAFTALHTFGAAPRPKNWLVQASDGHLYGVTTEVELQFFRVTLAGVFTVVKVLDAPAGFLDSMLASSDGNLYAVAVNDGRLCRVSLTGECTTIRTFTPFDGTVDHRLLAQTRDGRLVVTASQGGSAGRGAVLLVTPNGTLTDWYGFNDPEPLNPTGPLLLAPDGHFYGTSCRGGLFNLGAIFRMTPAGNVTTLHSFAYLDGVCPTSGLIAGTDGLFYGSSRLGGLFGMGTIYRIGPGSGLQVRHTFTGGDGAHPNRLMQASNGSLYGTTERGGAQNEGTIFRLTGGGSLAVLHSFGAAAPLFGRPKAGLMQAADGHLYGTTCSDGGAAFRMTLAGTVTPFTQLGWGQCSGSEPVQGLDGHLYATSLLGPGYGGIYRMTLTGDITIIFEFALQRSDGALPLGTLVQTADGTMYGTAFGVHQWIRELPDPPPVIYKITPEGVFTVVRVLDFPDGTTPLAGLTQGPGDTIYGTTLLGGRGEHGVVFRLTRPGGGL